MKKEPVHIFALSRSKPNSQVANVCLYVVESVRIARDAVARRLADKTRRALLRIPVVVHEVMKACLGYPSTERVALLVFRSLESDDEVECATGLEALANGDGARVRFAVGYADRAFMRMSRKISHDPGRRARILQQLMYRLYGRDDLIIAVAAGMIIWPRDGSRVRIVNSAP